MFLAAKAELYRKLARDRRYGQSHSVDTPQFSEYPETSGPEFSGLWTQISDATKAKFRAWNDAWRSVDGYWARVFQGDEPSGPAPMEPLGINQIAIGQVGQDLKDKLIQYKDLVSQISSEPAKASELTAELNKTVQDIEHLRHVLTLQRTEDVTAVLGSNPYEAIRQAVLGDLEPKQLPEPNPGQPSSTLPDGSGVIPDHRHRITEDRDPPSQSGAVGGTGSNAWIPNTAELTWLKRFFGATQEDGYGPELRARVTAFQLANGITPDDQAMIGPKTIRALVHAWYQELAEGKRTWNDNSALDLISGSQMFASDKQQASDLSIGYAQYVLYTEQRYWAILRLDKDQVTTADRHIQDAKNLIASAGGVQLADVPFLANKYRPLMDKMYTVAKDVASSGNDAEYALLLDMMDKAKAGQWDQIASAKAGMGDRWNSFWSDDATQKEKARSVAQFLGVHPVSANGSSAVVSQDGPSSAVGDDEFWRQVGAAPVQGNGSGMKFTASFQVWVDDFNAAVKRLWSRRSTDYAGTPADKLYETYMLTPLKVQQLWDVAYKNHVDPRVLLAILRQEGTGSFDTNTVNASHYNGGGPNPDWSADLEAAFDGLTLAKLRLYPAAVRGGFKGDWIDYVNWYTPVDRRETRPDGTVIVGASHYYAEDLFWANGVRRSLRDVSKAATPGASEDPASAFNNWMLSHADYFVPKYVQGSFRIEQGLPIGEHRPTVAVHPSLYSPEKYPDARLDPIDGWYHFPAPDYSVWRLTRS